MLSVRTKRANVTWRIMDQTMSNHLVLSLKPLPSFTSWTAFDATIVWPVRGMYICMGIQEILW